MGGVVGLLGAVTLKRLPRATLYETSPLDPRAYAAAVVVLLATLIIATYLPVRRALRVNPVDILRSE